MTRNHITQADNLIKYCIKCNHELKLGTNWAIHNQKGGRYICIDCQNKQHRDKYKDNHPNYGELRRNHITQMDNSIRYCNTCKCELIVGKNWSEGMKKTSHYTCKECNDKKCKEWRDIHPLYNTIHSKEYADANPERKRESDANWRMNNQDEIKIHRLDYENHTVIVTCIECGKLVITSDSCRKYCEDCASKKNVESRIKAKAKRKGYDSIFLFDNPFPKNILVVGHHISDAFVVYLPRSLHLNHLHGNYKQLHRDELQPYVEGIYNVSYIIEERRDY